MIWDGFRQYPPPATLAPTGDRIVDGWLALAPLATSGTTDLRRSLLAWRETYTDHPAAGVLLAELLAAQRAAGFPAQIALLLTADLAAAHAALAIRDGFLAAHLRKPSAASTAIRIYDTQQGGAQNAYLRAQLDGADFIVGPVAAARRRASDHAGGLRADARAEFRANRDAAAAQLLSVLVGAATTRRA